MERQFFYLFQVLGRPGFYRLGITADVSQEMEEGGLGLHPICRRRPRGKAREVELLASFWLGADASAVRDRIWLMLGRPLRWGNAEVELGDWELEQVLAMAMEAACSAIRLEPGFVTGKPELGDWEFQANAGLEEAVREVQWPAVQPRRFFSLR